MRCVQHSTEYRQFLERIRHLSMRQTSEVQNPFCEKVALSSKENDLCKDFVNHAHSYISPLPYF